MKKKLYTSVRTLYINDKPIYFSNDNGYIYGSVICNTVYPAYCDDSEDED